MKNTEENLEHGGAIIWILIAVALFAALTFTFNSSTRTSTSLITDTEAKAYANQVIEYGNEVKSAVKRLQLRGCSDTEISFENLIVASYTNANSPSNKKCHVFDSAGGGLTWKNFESSTTIFSGANVINGVGNDGTEGADLGVFVKGLKTEICVSINNALNHNFSVNPPVDGGTWGQSLFVGNYNFTNNIRAVGVGLDSLKSACFEDDNGENIYYSVLIVR